MLYEQKMKSARETNCIEMKKTWNGHLSKRSK